MYAIGAIIYYLLYKKFPTNDFDQKKSKQEIGFYYFNYNTYKVPTNVALSLDLFKLMFNCLRKNPDERFSVGEVFGDPYFDPQDVGSGLNVEMLKSGRLDKSKVDKTTGIDWGSVLEVPFGNEEPGYLDELKERLEAAGGGKKYKKKKKARKNYGIGVEEIKEDMEEFDSRR